jgi:hypothetical protein
MALAAGLDRARCRCAGNRLCFLLIVILLTFVTVMIGVMVLA